MVSAKSSKKLVEFVDALRDVMVPLILKTTVKGDDRIESAKIIWEDTAWSPTRLSEYGNLILANPNGELVVEVIVQEKLCTTRGAPWNIMKEVVATMDVVDWKRSAPYSVQEVRHAFGVEAARDCINLYITGEACSFLASILHEEGKDEEAAELMYRGLDIQERILEYEDVQIEETLEVLKMLLLNLGRHHETIPILIFWQILYNTLWP